VGLPRCRRLTAKLKIAQTPDGPQVWDWKAGFALPRAQLAWRAIPGGYIYEAALPWESIGGRAIAVGQRLGIEAGRGFGGNSFLDLSGRDPDSATNFILLLIVERAGQVPAATPVAAAAAGSDSVALSIALDGAAPIALPQQVAPDRDYLWLDQVGSAPLRLTAGQHTLRLTYASRDPQRSTIIDAFLLSPAIVTQRFTGPAGDRLTLHYNLRSAELRWDE
jgi:hypothetical protein